MEKVVGIHSIHVEAKAREETSNPARLVMVALRWDGVVGCCFRQLLFSSEEEGARFTYVSVYLFSSEKDGHISNLACDIQTMQQSTRRKWAPGRVRL
mmetsp:Transcript_6235/g.21915  ORF Transcript_6235/g.21915 Transcript_6235/m.21915 type:complete len:97 (-) Transcript_6235:26-316(-)